MKKLLILAYVISSLWAISNVGWGLTTVIGNISDGVPFSYLIGSIFGEFLLITTPLGVTITCHKYLTKKQKEKISHAI